jgi:hypothetical protein
VGLTSFEDRFDRIARNQTLKKAKKETAEMAEKSLEQARKAAV